MAFLAPVFSFLGAGAGAAGAGAVTAGAVTAGTTAASAGFLGTGLSFWKVLGLASTVVGTIGSIAGQMSMGNLGIEDAMRTADMVALDNARRQRDLERERSTAAARRAAVLAMQGGLDVGGGSDLVREALTEGSIESVRAAQDASFSGGVLQRRAANIRTGTNFGVLSSLATGGARIGSLLA
jgi:hypothetical protein